MSGRPPDAAGLFRRHHLEIFRFLRKMTADSTLAEDLCQEVFVRVARGLGEYADEGHERAWLYRIARNVLANQRRDAGRRLRPVSLDEIGPEPQRASAAEERLGLDEALARLEELDRQALLLREIGGLSYDEIAVACELTPGAVRNRLHRARRELRAQLTPSALSEPANETAR